MWLASPVAFYLVLLIGAALLPASAAPSAGGDGLPPPLAKAVDGFAHGNYGDVVVGNVLFTGANVFRRLVLMFFPRVFGMFLIGFYAGQTNLFAHLEANAPLLRKITVYGFTVGLPLAAVGAALGGSGSPRAPSLLGLVEVIAETIATPALTFAYAASVCLLFRRFPGAMVTLAPAGRMALTNYLMHSVIGIALFYGIGLGWYGRVSLTAALVGCVVVFALQVVASRLWLSFAQFGPAEWVWRMFTYRKRVPLLRGWGRISIF
jgi:uncharacterized protein